MGKCIVQIVYVHCSFEPWQNVLKYRFLYFHPLTAVEGDCHLTNDHVKISWFQRSFQLDNTTDNTFFRLAYHRRDQDNTFYFQPPTAKLCSKKHYFWKLSTRFTYSDNDAKQMLHNGIGKTRVHENVYWSIHKCIFTNRVEDSTCNKTYRWAFCLLIIILYIHTCKYLWGIWSLKVSLGIPVCCLAWIFIHGPHPWTDGWCK